MKRIIAVSMGLMTAATFACAGVQGETQNLGGITVTVPRGWKVEKPSSGFRKAQYRLPAEKREGGAPVEPRRGDKADAECVVFYFDSGQGREGGAPVEPRGGDVQSNLDRWYSFFSQPDGKPTKDKAKVVTKKVNGLNVTVVDMSGTYVASKMPGLPGSTEHFNEPDYRMLGAIVEGKDSYYIRCIGPAKTIAKWAKSFDGYVNSIKQAK